MDRMDHMHIGMQAIGIFYDRHGAAPRLHDETDAREVCEIAEQINKELRRVRRTLC